MTDVHKYPFKLMHAGDSFTVPAGEVRWDNLKSYSYRWGKKLKLRIVPEQLADGSIRVRCEGQAVERVVRNYALD